MGRPISSQKRGAIHAWLNENYPRRLICEKCGKKGKTGYAFRRHPEPYTRNIADYIELCRSCHCKMDGVEFFNVTTNRAKTHCVHGHEFTARNTFIRQNGSRACLACIKRRSAKYRKARVK